MLISSEVPFENWCNVSLFLEYLETRLYFHSNRKSCASNLKIYQHFVSVFLQ